MKDFFFSYFYYRITQVYFRWEKRNSITAAIAIAMFQSMVLSGLIIVFIVRKIYTPTKNGLYPTAINYGVVALLLALIVYNYKKYYNKYNSYKNKWKDESRRKRVIKGLLILLCLLLPWVLGFLALAKVIEI